MKVGDRETITYIWRWHECQECGMPAAFRISYLTAGNYRANPASSAYGRDDCTWCSDTETFACKKHVRQLEHNPPDNMSWCASFPLKKYKDMGFYKVKIIKPPHKPE